MKLTIPRKELLDVLGHMQSVVERRNTLPVLGNVMLRASDNILKVVATDLELEIDEEVLADVQEGGATTVSAHLFYDIVRKMGDATTVQLDNTADAGKLIVKSGRSRFTLSTLTAEDFPTLSAGELPHHFSLSAGDLRFMIDRTRFAISNDDTRYYLNGIYLHVNQATEGEEANLRAVATDGHRLARCQITMPVGAESIPGVIIPKKTVNELRKLAADSTTDVSIHLSSNKMQFYFDKIKLTSKLIDGTFPDYERVVPLHNTKVLTVPTRAFAEAVDRVATISSEKTRAVKMMLKTDQLVLSASSPEQGNAQEEMAVTYNADPIEIGFNFRYLLDIAQQIEGDGAQFILADGASPTIVRDPANSNTLYVLMPMRV
jgi:DNA polymerase-3 subunit beta